MKKVKSVRKILENPEFNTKISLYFSSKSYGDDYDPYEDDATFGNLNPLVIKGYVSSISAEALVWKQYGLQNVGALQIVCDEKYENWFRKCSKIMIGSDNFQTFREGVGSRSIIEKRAGNLIRVVITRK